MQLDFDANLATAETLPAALYVDPNVLEMEEERIFARTWQLIAHAGDLARVGDFLPTTIIDEPILLTRPEEQQLCAFFNVCRHRAAQVCTSRGNRKSLRCGYHGWVYGLDGHLQTAREMEDTENFEKADFGLRPVRVDTLGSFVFANLDQGAAPLGEWIGGIPAEIDPGGTGGYLREPGGTADALYYWIFPNTMLNIYQDNVSTNVILPLGPNRTLTIFEWFCAKRENGVHHFQSLVKEFLERP